MGKKKKNRGAAKVSDKSKSGSPSSSPPSSTDGVPAPSLVEAIAEAEQQVRATRAKNLPSEASRRATGQWLKGVSGNPNGRPRGSKNMITKERQALELALRQYINDPENFEKVTHSINRLFDIALTGEEKVAVNAIKLLMDKVMVSPKDDGEQAAGPGKIEVIITNDAQANRAPVIDVDVEEGDYEEVDND